MKTVFLTNIKNDFDRELAAVFAKNNWEVIFGEGDAPCAKKESKAYPCSVKRSISISIRPVSMKKMIPKP